MALSSQYLLIFWLGLTNTETEESETDPNDKTLIRHLKVLPLDEETASSILSPVAGFKLEMKRKPGKYAFLYFLPSGHNFSLILKFGIQTMLVSKSRSLCFCVGNKFLDSSVCLSCSLWTPLDNSAGQISNL